MHIGYRREYLARRVLAAKQRAEDAHGNDDACKAFGAHGLVTSQFGGGEKWAEVFSLYPFDDVGSDEDNQL